MVFMINMWDYWNRLVKECYCDFVSNGIVFFRSKLCVVVGLGKGKKKLMDIEVWL